MDMPKDFYDMVRADIERLSNTQNLSDDERLKLHREIDGKYQACVKQWYDGLWYNDRNEKNGLLWTSGRTPELCG